MRRLDGKPKEKWKWPPEKLANHKNAEYFGLDKEILQHFKGCHNRVRDGKAPKIQWPRSRSGFLKFCDEIGPKPNDGQKWSVGRKDHSKGYVKGNIRWELYAHNSVKRRGTKFENAKTAKVKMKERKK